MNMNPLIMSYIFLLLLALLLPLAFSLELKVQVVGWQQLSAYSHLLSLAPGKRFEVAFFKSQKDAAVGGPAVDSDDDGRGKQMLGHYEIGKFHLPTLWLNEMELGATGEFVRNNDYWLKIFTPGKQRPFPRMMKLVNFRLYAPDHNLVRVTLAGHAHAVNVLPMSQLELPTRNLLFKMLNRPTDPFVLLLKRIECQSGGWSIGDDSPGQKILLAKGQRVCEDDKYLVHTERYTQDKMFPKSPGQLLYEVAEYDLGKINLYEISFSGNGKLFCRLERPPSSQGSTQLILGSEQENIIDIWPTVVAQMQAHLMQAQMQAHPLTAFDFGGREEQPEAKRQRIIQQTQQRQQSFTFGGVNFNPAAFNPSASSSANMMSYQQPQSGEELMLVNQQPHQQQQQQLLPMLPQLHELQMQKLKQKQLYPMQYQPQQQFVPMPESTIAQGLAMQPQQQPLSQQHELPLPIQQHGLSTQQQQSSMHGLQRQMPRDQWLAAAWQQFGPPFGAGSSPPQTNSEFDQFFGQWKQSIVQKEQLAMAEAEKSANNFGV